MPRDYCTGPVDEIRMPECSITTGPRPTRDSCVAAELKIKEIHIKQLDHGYLLKVGCKEIALSSAEELIFGLRRYLKDPYKTQELFEKREFKFTK